MKNSPLGNSPRKTDTVARAMDILKDRPMTRPKPDQRRNLFRKADHNNAARKSSQE
jgi:hypothetical protein